MHELVATNTAAGIAYKAEPLFLRCIGGNAARSALSLFYVKRIRRSYLRRGRTCNIRDLSLLPVCNRTFSHVGYGGVRRKEVLYSSTVSVPS